MSTNECPEQSTSQNSQRKIRGFWCEPSPPIPYEEGMKAWQEAQKKAQNYEVKCALCKENGDPPEVYSSHKLRENGVVQCPILRKYKCRVCHATGDNAHTISYCPMKNQLVDKEFFGPQYFHNMAGLKKVPYNSAGMQKKNYAK